MSSKGDAWKTRKVTSKYINNWDNIFKPKKKKKKTRKKKNENK